MTILLFITNMIKVGILSVQGAVAEHKRAVEAALRSLEIEGEAVLVKSPGTLASSDALIIPGGESTTISKLITKFELAEPLTKHVLDENFPVMGTCAGSILLAREGDEKVERTGTRLLRLMDYRVSRNAFGSQRESFEMPLVIDGIATEEEPFPGVFIRAPLILEVYNDCKPLGHMPDETGIIAARQNNLLGFVFHPELTDDLRVHQYFIKMIL